MSKRQSLVADCSKGLNWRKKTRYPGKIPEESTRTHTFVISSFEGSPSAERILGTQPGEILQHYEIGALVAPYDSRRVLDPYAILAKLEYAINAINVHNLLVLGNTGSRSLSYLTEGTPNPALSGWMGIAHNATERAYTQAGSNNTEEIRKEILHQTILQSMRNLLTYPIVYNAVKQGKLCLEAGYYNPAEKMLYLYDERQQAYTKVQLKEKSGFFSSIGRKCINCYNNHTGEI